MKRFRFKKIDAFTRGDSPGNPAGCVYLRDSDEITEEEMQRLARELKGFVSEVVYLFPEGEGAYLRYFSSECEVDFCGHGTIAAMYDYILDRPDLNSREEFRIRVGDAFLPVYNRIPSEDAVYITAPAPSYRALPADETEIRSALGGAPAAGDEWRASFINAGLNTLIVPVKDLDACLALHPEEAVLRDFCLRCGADIVLVFSTQTARGDCLFRTRVFAPKFGYLEDPATGSGNSAFGCYLLRESRWDGAPMLLEQNGLRESPNLIRLSSHREGGEERVLFGGSATVRIDGHYCLGPG